ncbi:SDR family oxidoreductase [bacterium]|nr:SDR family oxidoreductase [bacterium]
MNFNSDDKSSESHWALILGGSSGFGLATAKKLAENGMNIMVVHRDRRGAMKNIQPQFDQIATNNNIKFFTMNIDALSEKGRGEIISTLKDCMGESGKVRLLLHSIAFGNLRPIVPSKKENQAEIAVAKLAEKLGVNTDQVNTAVADLLDEGISELHTLQEVDYGSNVLGDEDMEQTIYNMGTSLLTWVQDVFNAEIFAKDARVIGLTSEGNTVAWKGYGAVAAAKVALESVSRAIAVEFAAYGIRSNILQPGVTPTPALKLIPGHHQMESVAKMRNPFSRTTTPQDVANVVALMCTDEASWINGTIIRVDGGEHVASL